MKPQAEEAAAARRQILADHRDIASLAETITSSSDRRELAACAAQLQTLLQRHFRTEEGLDGLHATIRARSPERDAQLHRLGHEHAELLREVRRLRELAGTRGNVDELHALGVELVGRLRAHEANENDVFLGSMWRDLGLGD